mgnify:CR=1 FL=1
MIKWSQMFGYASNVFPKMYSTNSLPPIKLECETILTSVLVQMATAIPLFSSVGIINLMDSFTWSSTSLPFRGLNIMEL